MFLGTWEQLFRITGFFYELPFHCDFCTSINNCSSNFNVYKLIGWDVVNTCLKSKVETLEQGVEKCEICSKLTIKTVEPRSDDFIVNFELLYVVCSVAFVDYEQMTVGEFGLYFSRTACQQK